MRARVEKTPGPTRPQLGIAVEDVESCAIIDRKLTQPRHQCPTRHVSWSRADSTARPQWALRQRPPPSPRRPKQRLPLSVCGRLSGRVRLEDQLLAWRLGACFVARLRHRCSRLQAHFGCGLQGAAGSPPPLWARLPSPCGIHHPLLGRGRSRWRPWLQLHEA